MDQEKTHSSRSRLLQVAGSLVVLLTLYALSIGPAIYFLAWSRTGHHFYQTLYRPLIDATAKTQLDPALNAYGEWWADLRWHWASVRPFPPWQWTDRAARVFGEDTPP